MDKRASILLAAPGETARQWYTRLSGDQHFDIPSYANTVDDLQRKLETKQPEGLLVDSQLFAGPDGLREILEQFPNVTAFVVLPPHAAEGVTADIRSIPSVAAGFLPDQELSELAAEVHEMLVNTRQVFGTLMCEREATPVAAYEPVQPAPMPVPPGGGRVVAFWSGPTGGTGCTTMALAFSALAATCGVGTILLALSEPAVAPYLHLQRVPNIASFFTATDNSLQAATQTIGWGSRGAQVGLQVILGPTRPRDGEPVSSAELSAVIETARCESECVVVDVPSLTPPATSPWTRTPLKHATDIVLVMAPTVTGISAAVEALSTLSEIPTAGRVSVLLNQRAPGGAFSTREFRAAVESIWRGCPEVTRVGFVPELPGSMNEGQMPDSDILGDSLKAMGDFIGLPGPEPAAPRGRKGFSLGRLRISLGG